MEEIGFLKNDSVRTLSIHIARGWPLDSDMYKSGELNPSFIPSDIDIPVLSGEEDRYSEKHRAFNFTY